MKRKIKLVMLTEFGYNESYLQEGDFHELPVIGQEFKIGNNSTSLVTDILPNQKFMTATSLFKYLFID